MEKPLKKTAKGIGKTQIKLKQKLNKYLYIAIENTIQIYKETTKKILQQLKFKKYNYVKNNPQPSAKATDFQEENENWAQPHMLKLLLLSH